MKTEDYPAHKEFQHNLALICHNFSNEMKLPLKSENLMRDIKTHKIQGDANCKVPGNQP